MISCLRLKSLIHFEFIFVYGVRKGSNFIFIFAYNSLVCTTLFTEETVFTPSCSLTSFVID